MERKAVKSSQIQSIGYDPETKTLEVEFKNGAVYTYQNVEEDHHKALMTAKSHGSHFGQHIKPHVKKFPFAKIRGTDKEEEAKRKTAGGAK